MKILKEKEDKFGNKSNLILDTIEISLNNLNGVGNDLSKKILFILAKKELYPKQIAKEIRIHEQNVYYYIKKLERANLIKIVRQENINGTIANFYSLVSDSFFFTFKKFKKSNRINSNKSYFLDPFILKSKLNSLIIVGSPDPHGPQKARSRDGYFGMDLALFLGTYLNHISDFTVKLDTEVNKYDLKNNNLIVLGGPIVNKVSELINLNMQIYFDKEKNGIYSKISKKMYFDDEIGIINKFESPFNKKKKILFIAGIRNSGTKSAILSFLKYFHKIEEPNIYDKSVYSKVVLGLDLNSDGEVDDIEFLE